MRTMLIGETKKELSRYMGISVLKSRGYIMDMERDICKRATIVELLRKKENAASLPLC